MSAASFCSASRSFPYARTDSSHAAADGGSGDDELIGGQDIVIKSLGESFKRFRGIAGAADLGDQRTILVLDVGGMINETMRVGH